MEYHTKYCLCLKKPLAKYKNVIIMATIFLFQTAHSKDLQNIICVHRIKKRYYNDFYDDKEDNIC